jgi:hypothetical protein
MGVLNVIFSYVSFDVLECSRMGVRVDPRTKHDESISATEGISGHSNTCKSKPIAGLPTKILWIRNHPSYPKAKLAGSSYDTADFPGIMRGAML